MEKNYFDPVCLRYSVPALLAATAVSAFFILVQGSLFSWTGLFTAYVLGSAVAVVGVLSVRVAERGMSNTMTVFETSVAVLSALGFSLPVALLGVLMAGIDQIDYEGAERWLPDIEGPEQEIQRIITELELSQSVYNRSLMFLETVANYGLMKGRPISEMAPAIVYISAREENEPRTLEEVSQTSRASKKEIGRAYRYIGRNTDISIVPPSPLDYVERFADRMGLSQDVKTRASMMVERAEEISVASGKSPGGMAASALYLSAYTGGEDRTMRDMADTLGMTSATIRNRSKDLVEALELADYPEHLEGEK